MRTSFGNSLISAIPPALSDIGTDAKPACCAKKEQTSEKACCAKKEASKKACCATKK
jgi:hypothetical protein